MAGQVSALPRSATHGRAAALGVAVGLALVPAAASGFARFAYALVLPSMQSALGWSYATGGAINTASAAGFLAGSVAAAPVITRFGEHRVLAAGMGLTAATALATAASGNLAILASLRVASGFTAAIAFVTGAALVTRISEGTTPRRAALMLGIYFAGGGGLGIIVPGLVVPPVLAAGGWRMSWLTLGAMSVAGTVISVLCARRVPGAAAGAQDSRRPAGLRALRALPALLAGYGLFGAGYIAYMTFIVAYLGQQGAGGLEIGAFWVLLGGSAVAGTLAWSPVLGRLGGGRGPALTLVAVLAGTILPVLSGSMAAAYASAVIFGGSFLATPASVTGCARQTLPERYWTSAIGGLTVAFSAGQCLGPVLAGVLSDGPGGVRAGLITGAALLAASIAITILQPSRDPHPDVRD